MDKEAFLGDGEGRESISIKDASIDIRKGFVRKVYGILSAQMLATVMIAAPIVKGAYASEDVKAWASGHSWLLVISTLGVIFTQCAMCCCQEAMRKYPTNYVFLGVFTVAESLLVAYVSALYTWQSVLLCASMTVGIFVSMTIYAWVSDIDFTGFAPYLAGALFALFFFGLTLSLLSLFGVAVEMAVMFYNLCAVLIFTCYIFVDTQKILGEWGGHTYQFEVDDYCFAALNLYLDIVQLFIYLLRLFGDRR